MTAAALRKNEESHPEQRRVRACLKCSEKFESAWAGERICRRCKGSSTWQSGASMDMVSARSGRGR
jgi:hypothetical protein